jgi:type I restriction enzyme, R subunit
MAVVLSSPPGSCGHILDEIFAGLPTPPFSVEEKEQLAKNVYAHVWQQAVRGDFSAAA